MTTWVLIRGLTRERGHWGDFPDLLASALAHPRVVTIDLPGNGALYREKSPWIMRDIVERCRAALKQQAVERPVYLLALSLGGMVSMDWASRYPEEIAGVTLINTSFKGVSLFNHRLRPTSYAKVLRLFFDRNIVSKERRTLELTSQTRPPHVLARWVALRQAHPVSVPNALRQLIAAWRFKAPPTLPPVPFLVLSGAKDQLVNPRCSELLAARWRLPHRQHPTAGHDLPLDDPTWVVKQVQTWFESELKQR